MSAQPAAHSKDFVPLQMRREYLQLCGHVSDASVRLATRCSPRDDLCLCNPAGDVRQRDQGAAQRHRLKLALARHHVRFRQRAAERHGLRRRRRRQQLLDRARHRGVQNAVSAVQLRNSMPMRLKLRLGGVFLRGQEVFSPLCLPYSTSTADKAAPSSLGRRFACST